VSRASDSDELLRPLLPSETCQELKVFLRLLVSEAPCTLMIPNAARPSPRAMRVDPSAWHS